jgi:hypothetical protein
MTGPELVQELHDAIARTFPASDIKVKLGNSLGGDKVITIWFALGAPGTHANGIWHNDPISQIITIYGINNDDTIADVLETTSKARLTVKSKDPLYAYGSVKLPWRNLKGNINATITHIKNYFAKVKDVVKANIDELPDSFKTEGLGLNEEVVSGFMPWFLANREGEELHRLYGEHRQECKTTGERPKSYKEWARQYYKELHEYERVEGESTIKSFKSFCNEDKTYPKVSVRERDGKSYEWEVKIVDSTHLFARPVGSTKEFVHALHVGQLDDDWTKALKDAKVMNEYGSLNTIKD